MTVEEARKILGKKADKYSDDELVEVIRNLTQLADLAIDSVLAQRKVHEKTPKISSLKKDK